MSTFSTRIRQLQKKYQQQANRLQKQINLEQKATGIQRLLRYERQLQRFGIAASLSLSLLGLVPQTGLSQIIPASSEFLVNTFTTGSQEFVSVATDSDGNFVVVWESGGQDGSSDGIYAQRYNSSGVAQGSEFLVNNFTTSSQELPSVAMDSDGDFVVVWNSIQDGDGNGIYGRRYNSDGVAQGSEFLVNTFTTDSQVHSSVAMDSDGNFVVVWYSGDQDGDSDGIYAQRYNSSGVAQGGEFLVNNFTTGTQRLPSIAMDSDGDFVVVWQSGDQDGSSNGVYGRRYNSSGVAQGNEFQVNAYTTGTQGFPDVAIDSDGNFVVAWNSKDQDGSDYGVYAQRYNSSGDKQGSEFLVNTYTTAVQRRPSIAMDSDGDFVVVWQSREQDGSNYGVYAQRYNSSGTVQGSEFQVSTYTTDNQASPDVAIDSDGDFVVAWESTAQDGGSRGIYAQRYENIAAGDEFQVNTTTGNTQNNPSVATDSDGNFVVTWQSRNQDGSNYGIYGQRYNAIGVAQGGEFLVNTYTTNYQISPSVAMDSDGDFVITWQSKEQDGSNEGIYGQRYSSSGVAQGGEFQVNTFTTSDQTNPSVAMDDDGNFVVTWQSRDQDGNGFGIYVRRYNSSGVAQGGEFQVNTYTTSYQNRPSVAMDSDGDFVVTWVSSRQDGSYLGIYAQRYNSDGTTNGVEFQVNTFTTSDQTDSSVAMDDDGNFVVTWESYGQDGSNRGIYVRRYNSLGEAQGSEFQVNTYTTNSQFSPSVAMDSDGDFVVTWTSYDQDSDRNGIYGQRYNSSGAAQGSEFQVNTYITNDQSRPSVAMDSDGDFVVTWESNEQDGSRDGIYAQRYNLSAPCTALAGELGNSEDTATIELCVGTDSGILFEQTGANATDEYAFLLADQDQTIIASNSTGDFDLASLSVGTYTVYGLSYASTNNPSTIADYLLGKTISDIETDDADASFCLELSSTASIGETNLITIKPLPVISQQPSDQAICPDETATFEVTASGSNLEYQWQQDGIDLTGEDNPNLVINNITSSDEGEYNVLITENGCTISSDTVNLVANNASATIPDISSLVFNFCTKPFTASFDAVPAAVAYFGEVTVTVRQNQVITRLVPMSPVNGTFKIPRRIIGSVVTVRLAAVFVDPITNQQVFGEFSCPKNFLVACDETLVSGAVSSRSETINWEMDVQLSPNPADAQLTLRYEALEAGAGALVVLDAMGKVVLQEKLTNLVGDNQVSINIQHLASGMYHLKLVLADETRVLPFVKE